MNLQTIEIARGHVGERAIQRTSMDPYMHKAMLCVARKVKARKVPNGEWYFPARKDNHIIGYICGKGCYISTVLAPSMVPKGICI